MPKTALYIYENNHSVEYSVKYISEELRILQSVCII